MAPLTLRLSAMVQSLGQDWHLLTAAAFVSMAMPLLVFFTLQRYFVRGILAGSVKGVESTEYGTRNTQHAEEAPCYQKSQFPKNG